VTVSFEQAAWSWTEHLRAGGARPWSAWVADEEGGGVAVPAGWTPPGAAQLEFVRRAAAVTGPGLPVRFADRVFGRSGPARGLANLPLGWPGTPTSRPFGPPMTDPAEVPQQELIRVGVGVLTDLLLAGTGSADDREWRVRRRLLGRDPAFELVGSPVTTAAVRRALALAGHVEGGRAPSVALLAEPLDVALLGVWSARVQRGAPARWRGFVARAAHRLPPSADLAGLARCWADRVGPESVHVVVVPPDAATASRLAAEALRLPFPGPPRRRPAPTPPLLRLSPAAVDVVRRVNAVLAVRAGTAEHARAVRALAILLRSEHGESADPGHLAVPEPFREWARQHAERMADDLRHGGYAVHGDLGRIVPDVEGTPTRPDRDTVLRLVLTASVALASRTGDLRTTKERDR
jgi:hypothetical protein